MVWRLARSLVTLRSEVWAVAPGTTVWTIGDADHQARASDHNPNPAGVVCAIDILRDAGLDLAAFVATITATDPPALKYVIHRDRIWFPQTGWQRYRGQFHSHVHVSVGWGPDGRSIGPYDDTSPWGLIEEGDMDQGDIVRHTNLNVGTHLRWTLRGVQALEAGQKAILAQLAGEDVAEAAEAAARVGAQAAVREEFATLGPALAAQLSDVPAEQVEAALRAVLGSLDEEA